MSKIVARFAKNNSGATAIEYGLIAALIALVIIGGVTTIGTGLSGTFSTISGSLGGGDAGGGEGGEETPTE